MQREEKRIVELDRYEHGILVNALYDQHNDLLAEKRATDAVDDVLLKVIDAPTKKVRCRREAR